MQSGLTMEPLAGGIAGIWDRLSSPPAEVLAMFISVKAEFTSLMFRCAFSLQERSVLCLQSQIELMPCKREFCRDGELLLICCKTSIDAQRRDA